MGGGGGGVWNSLIIKILLHYSLFLKFSFIHLRNTSFFKMLVLLTVNF